MRRTVGFVAAALAAACWALPGVALADEGAGDSPDVMVVEVGDPGSDGEIVLYSLPPGCDPAADSSSDDTTTDRIPCEWFRNTTCPDDTTADECPVYAPTNGGGGEEPLPIEDKSGGGPESMSGTPDVTADTGGGTSGGDASGGGTSGGEAAPDDAGAADGGAVIAPAPSNGDPAANGSGDGSAAVGGSASDASAEPVPAAGAVAANTPAAPADSGAPVALVVGVAALAAAGVAGAAVVVRRRHLPTAR
jgi:hypothetical protein